ncbi:hypothetical protein PG984_014631 [Apiospora sp. TS-2023a]
MNADLHSQISQPENSTYNPACDICRDVKRGLTQPSYIDFGSVNAILAKRRPCHDALFHFLNRHPSTDSVPNGYRKINLWNMDGTGGEFELIIDDETWIASDHALLEGNVPDTMGTSGLVRLLDADWVEEDLLREWLSECLAEHEQTCEDPFKLSRVSPAWLIDTIDNCLVDGDGVQDYVALSYRWGTTKQLQDEINILVTLQQSGALLQAQFVDFVSPTIRHAMGLVRIMGERYLWVDALCIVQDKGEETAAQLRLMGAIYASARLTIVAADGDASYGIPGLRGISQPRQLRQIKFPLGQDGHVLIRQTPVFRNADGCTPYFVRAWTYQEYMHSKRRLIVGNNQFHWNCCCMTHHEDMNGADLGSHKWLAQIQFPNILSGIPDFLELNTVAAEYNSRDLSFEEDALAGVSGLLSVMSRGFVGGFIYGLPEMCFDAALMWMFKRPLAHETQLEQRRVHSGRNHTILQGSTLPSWSWLGWKGAVSLIGREHSQDVVSSGWSTKESRNGTARSPLFRLLHA